MTKRKKHFLVYLPTIIGGLILVGAIVLIVHLISNMEDKPAKKERKIQKITLAEPPPPPPPPKIEKPPEPESEQKIEEQAEPEPESEPMPDVAPPGDLGLDAEGTAGSDSFGLAARKGGKGLLGGGGGGSPFAWYGNMAKSDIANMLNDTENLRRKAYTAIIKLWVDADGTIEKFELARGSNDAEIDDLLEKIISKYKRINESVPPGMPQPIKLKITSRI